MAQTAALAEVVAYLDGYLRVREIPDYDGAVNGLQVENGGTIDRIVAAVDASQATIDGAAALAGSPLLLVHHGLFFDGNLPVTGRRFRRLRTLLTHDIAVYSSHLPLDAHPEVGNNAVLARLLGIELQGAFGNHRGSPIGVWGLAPSDLASRDALSTRLRAVLGLPGAPRVIPGGPACVSRVGIVTGGAGTMVKEARDAGLDTFITGEGPHHTYFDAIEFGVNVFHAGHYATETVGVRALAEHLGARFGLPHIFHDHPTGM
jgi:dinuclear metal center YbgI/SA1388 family protein